MIRIAITREAHAAIAATIEKGRALDDLQELQDGRLWIWLPRNMARALASLRRPGEDYSATIVRIFEREGSL
jgi:hypothetical protein